MSISDRIAGRSVGSSVGRLIDRLRSRYGLHKYGEKAVPKGWHHCSFSIDRDLNAAINLEQYGCQLTVVTACCPGSSGN